MVTFRKSLLLMAILGVLASVASAQVGQTPAFQCVANAGVPPLVRAEGLAELVGDVVLNCTGGTPTQLAVEVPKVNIRVFLNTNVTSRLLDGSWNEALLMIDEPTPAEQLLCTASDGCSILGVGQEPGVDYATTYNMWQGRFVTGNTVSEGNTVEWLGVPVDPPGTQATRIIRITNIRANAAQKGVGGGLIPSQLIIFISATGTTSIPINNPQQIVAFVQDGLTFSAGSDDYLQCEEPEGKIGLTFTERFATAFKRRNVATDANGAGTVAAQNGPGVIYNTETGFYNPALDNTHGASKAGLASQGTRLVARFKNIPSGVEIWVSNRDITGPGTGQNGAVLVSSADSNGKGGTAGAYPGTVGYVKLSVSGGAATATWEVLVDNPLSNDDVDVDFFIDYTPNTTAGVPALGTAAVAGSYGPLSDLIAAVSDDLQPRFIDDSEDSDVFTINSCATNLLWPYVTNQAGFDTGLVISNTSMDPFGTASQEGACEIYYYGNSNGGDPPAMDTTPVVGAGGYAVWTLSSGGGVKPYGKPLEGSIAAAPGFEGYVIAHCFFQYAHGYGFLSDLGAQKLAQGYLALILDEPIWGGGNEGSRTRSKSEPLNQ